MPVLPLANFDPFDFFMMLKRLGATLERTGESMRLRFPKTLSDEQKHYVQDLAKQNKSVILAYMRDLERDEELIRHWLAGIGETDQEVIAETIGRVHGHKGAREYFVTRGSEK